MNATTDNKDRDTLCGLRVEEHEVLQRQLCALTDAPPPREVWRRIERQARAEGLLQRRLPPAQAKWLAGASVAAAVALMALNLPPFSGEAPDGGPFPTVPTYTEAAGGSNLAALMIRSQRLESNLRALPSQRGVVRAGTAATISDLEDRIAVIDATLNDPQADLSAREAELFWRERVRLMDSLLQVRYAQAQRVSF